MSASTFRGVSPYVYYEDVGAALDWLARAFGFTERVRYLDADGVVREAETSAGDVPVFWQHLDTPVRLREGWSEVRP